MTIEKTKRAFEALGSFLAQFRLPQPQFDPNVRHNELFFDRFGDLIQTQKHYNGWFTEQEVCFAIASWADALRPEELDKWLSSYKFVVKTPRTIGLVLAGNIPLVGFHDFLCVLMSGNKALVRTASSDQKLLPFLAKYLVAEIPELDQYITFTNERLQGYDAVIATGSNNTSRYFEYYFKDKPSIIRKNRNSVAVLTGSEKEEELVLLGADIFRYFGLGCRSVSKIFVPEGYDFENFFKAMYHYREVIDHQKYINNYDYNKAVFLMSNYLVLDNGFMVLKEDKGYASPISSVFYEYYTDIDSLRKRLQDDKELLQCIVSNGIIPNSVGFGQTQSPHLWDYADQVDTFDFLLKL